MHPLKVAIPGVVAEGGEPVYVQVEPLPFVLLDTLPRLSRQTAVVALDAVMAGRYGYQVPVKPEHLHGVEDWLWSRWAREAWQWAVRFADPLSESAGESRSRVVIEELGFVRPRLQSEVRLPGGKRARLDFDWHEDGVFGEFDGRMKYDDAVRLSGTSDQGVYWEEKRREEAIELVTGRRGVRWSWNDLDRPKDLERKLLLRGVSKR